MDDRVGASDHPDGDGVDAVAARVLRGVAARPDVLRVGLGLVEGAGRRLRFTASDRLEGDGPRWCLVDAYDDVPLTTVVRTGEPVLGDLDELEPRYAGFARRQRDAGAVAVAVLPVPGPRGPLGGLVVYFVTSQLFDEQQALELAAAAEEVSMGLESGPDLSRAPDDGDGESADGAQVASIVVGGDPLAARTARQFLRRELAAWDVEHALTDVAVLCLSELVTNAVMHTGTPSELRVRLDESTLTMVVRDRGGPQGSSPAPDDDPDPLRVHGRGLQLVEALAHRWGTDHDDAGTTVWVELHRRSAS